MRYQDPPVADLKAQIIADQQCAIKDEFRGDTEHLRTCIKSLIQLEDAKALSHHGIGGIARSLLAASFHRLANFTSRRPTHRCKICGALWIEYPDSWSLFSADCGKCCDNASMGDQIEKLQFA